MRVLHVYKSYFPETQGGLEETIRQICHSTSHQGVTNEIFTLGPRQGAHRIEREEATVRRWPRDLEIASCGMSASALAQFRAAAQDVDLLHYHYPWPFADLMHLTSGTNTPSVLTYHSDVVRQRLLQSLYRPLRDRFLKQLSRIVCTSPNYLASSPVLATVAQQRPERPPVDIIPIGLDPKTYPEPDTATLHETEQRWGRDFFLFVGMLRYYKGLHILLEAAAHSPLPVVITGSGPEEAALKAQAHRAGLGNVHFTGYVSDTDKAALYRLSRGVVFPSHLRSEAFGVSLVEGAMYGKPLISTDIGTGTSYVNAHRESGLVVPPNDATALHHAMSQLYQDEALSRRLGQGARQRYEALFTAERMGTSYMALYNEVLGRKPEAPQSTVTGTRAVLSQSRSPGEPSQN